jgi:hypothetical protein
VHHGDAEKGGREVEFVAVSRESLRKIVEELELRAGVLKLGLERLKN